MLTVPLSWVYRAGNLLDRKLRFALGRQRLDCPVISIGNLSVGGTGKTPFVIAFAKMLQAEIPALRAPGAIAILSRGYGRESNDLVVVHADTPWKKCGDEPLMIKRSVPNAAVVVHRKRAIAGRFAKENFQTKLCLLDDGFQHYELKRNLDLVLMDGSCPLGNGHMLPAGPLREPTRELKRATAIVSVGQEHGETELLANKHGVALIRAHVELELDESLKSLRGVPVLLLTGIARPERMLRLLREQGLNVVSHAVFPDHWNFTASDLVGAIDSAKTAGAAAIITTPKDAIRLDGWNHEIPLHTVHMRLVVDDQDILFSFANPLVQDTVKSSR